MTGSEQMNDIQTRGDIELIRKVLIDNEQICRGMTGAEFARLRNMLGLTTVQWGRAVGYTGTDASVASSVRRLEAKREKHIPAPVGKLTRNLLMRYGFVG